MDTNVVLDWLLFRNPDSVAIEAAVTSGRVRWVATQAMRDELAHVLDRGDLAAWSSDLSELWAAWHRHCHHVFAPLPPARASHPRCTDPDDQKFVDLAIACNARWLISRDRAVLGLAGPLRNRGIKVMTLAAWAAASPTGQL